MPPRLGPLAAPSRTGREGSRPRAAGATTAAGCASPSPAFVRKAKQSMVAIGRPVKPRSWSGVGQSSGPLSPVPTASVLELLKLVWSCTPPHAPAMARSVLELFWERVPNSERASIFAATRLVRARQSAVCRPPRRERPVSSLSCSCQCPSSSRPSSARSRCRQAAPVCRAPEWLPPWVDRILPTLYSERFTDPGGDNLDGAGC